MEEQKTIPVFVCDPAPIGWPVDVRVPVAGGSFETRRFTAALHLLSEADYARLLDADPTFTDNAGTAMSDADQLADNARKFAKLVAGWSEVMDAAGNALPFSQDALTRLVTGPHGKAVSAGLWKAVSEVRYGVRLGNSEAPPVAG